MPWRSEISYETYHESRMTLHHRTRVLPRLLLLLLPFLAACAGGGQSVSETDPSQVGTRLADAMLRGGNPTAALQVTDNVLANHPHDRAARLQRAHALTALGRSGEAAQELGELAREQPRDLTVLAALAAARSANGDAAGSESAWRSMLEQQPSSRQGRIGLAIALDLQERHAEAQTMYRQVLHDTPDDTTAMIDLGLSLALSGQTTEALSLLDRPGVSRRSPRAQHNLAVALVLAGDESRAHGVLRQDMNEEDTTAAIRGVRALARN
jgi:Flp pilus assembly protein TadD